MKNNNLIQTAPELLEACKEALKDLQLLHAYLPRHRRSIEKLKYVIKKADKGQAYLRMPEEEIKC